jgi:Tol biopolymer transport system component
MNRAGLDLTDEVLHDALAHRAAGAHTPYELVNDVLAAVDALPQRRGAAWQVTPTRRLLPVLLVLGLLLSSIIGFAMVVGGRAPNPVLGSGDIAYVAATYGWDGGFTVDDQRIAAVSTDGGSPTFLTDVPGTERPIRDAWYPTGGLGRVGPMLVWSPDGSRIAFRLVNDGAGIYLMNRDGSGLTLLVDLPRDRTGYLPLSAGLDWSPDGAQIAFTYPYDHGSNSPIYLVDTDDGGLRNLTGDDPARGGSGTVAWSPDGSRIAVARRDSVSASGLVLIDANGAGEQRLLAADRAGFHLGAPEWSPDGSMIAFVRQGSPAAGPDDGLRWVHVINADGTGLREIAGPLVGGSALIGPADEVLAWSPDGSQIACMDGEGGISLVAVDGSGVRELAVGDVFAWSPDGSRLVFSGDGPAIPGAPATHSAPSIWLINADGTGVQWLADGEYPAWAPSAVDSE